MITERARPSRPLFLDSRRAGYSELGCDRHSDASARDTPAKSNGMNAAMTGKRAFRRA